MKKGMMLVDVNNIGFAAQSKTVLKVGDLQTQAIFGVLRTLRALTYRFPNHRPIVLWDGLTWRREAFKDYKGNRDKPAKSKHEQTLADQRQHYRKARPYIERGLSLLGVRQLTAANLEADDLAAMIVRRYPENKILLISGDKDWVQLIGPKVSWLSPVHYDKNKGPLLITPSKIKDVLGVESGRAWLEVKAIHGDMGDNVPGVGGIGIKGATELVNQFGTVANFFNAVIFDKDPPFEKLPKKLQALVEEQEKKAIYQRNMMLMDLNHHAVPKPIDLVRDDGKFDPEGFAAFCRELLFKSILTDVHDWMAPFNPNPVPFEEAA